MAFVSLCKSVGQPNGSVSRVCLGRFPAVAAVLAVTSEAAIRGCSDGVRPGEGRWQRAL